MDLEWDLILPHQGLWKSMHLSWCSPDLWSIGPWPMKIKSQNERCCSRTSWMGKFALLLLSPNPLPSQALSWWTLRGTCVSTLANLHQESALPDSLLQDTYLLCKNQKAVCSHDQLLKASFSLPGLLWSVLSRPMLPGRQEALRNYWMPGVLSQVKCRSAKLPGLLHVAWVGSRGCCWSKEERMAVVLLWRSHYLLQLNSCTRGKAELLVMHSHKANVSRKLADSRK